MSKTGTQLTEEMLGDSTEMVGKTAAITGVLQGLKGTVGYVRTKGFHNKPVVLTKVDVDGLSDATKAEIIALMETKF